MDVVTRIDYNTGGYQPPVTREASIKSALCRRNKPSWVDKAITEARKNDQIFRYNYDGTAYLGIDDTEKLREKVASYAERRKEPRKDLIAIANEWISMETDNE